MLKDRVSQIDVDCPNEYRPQIYQHIFDSFGQRKCAYVLALGTISDKGTIDDIGRALSRLWSKENPNDNNNPYSLDKIAQIKKQFDENPEETKKIYPKLFYYFDGLNGTVVSLSHHPAGVIIAPIDIYSRYGMFIDKENLSVLNLDMSAAHNVGLVKYDILGLDTISVIDKTCKYAHIPYPHTYQIDFNDKAVWDGIKKSKYGIFQFTGDFAFNSLKKYDVQSIDDVCAVTACIRPSGASYRDRLLNHEHNKNPSKQIDELLKKNNGFLIYQEDIIAFLQQVCGLSGSDADTVRRAIGHKDKKCIKENMPKILEGYCSHSDKPKDVAEKEAKDFLEIIDNSSNYMFGFNHSIGYSILTYYCAYYRHYYPVEFVTALLNTADTDEKILNGTTLAKELGITIFSPKYGYSKSEYVPNTKNQSIYKGVASIKRLNQKAANELYALSQQTHYDSFMDLLQDIHAKTSVSSDQLEILIKIDYFSDFGDINSILEQVKIYNTFNGRKQISRADLEKYQLPEELMNSISGKVTEKLYKDFDWKDIVKYKLQNSHIKPATIIDKAKYELECLGYIQITNDNIPECYAIISNIEGKYKSKTVSLYRIHDGTTDIIKVKGKTLESYPLKVGDMIKTIEIAEENKWGKDADGHFYKKDETEMVLKKYSYVN